MEQHFRCLPGFFASDSSASYTRIETLIANERLDEWCSIDGIKEPPADNEAFLRQERRYLPDINDGVRNQHRPTPKGRLVSR